MVEFIIGDFRNVRGGGNIKSDVPTINDFILENCTLEESGNEGEFILSAGISDVDSVSLAVSPGTVTVGGTVTFTATVLDDEENPLENKNVVFKTGSDIVGTGTTNSSGIAAYTMTMDNYGTFTCTASCSGVTSTAVVVIVNRIVPTISLAAVSSTISVGDSPSLTGSLSVGSGSYVQIYQGSSLIDTVITGVDGAFSYTGSATSSAGTLTFKAVFEGDSIYSSVESSSVTITVSGGTPVVDSVSLSSDKSVLSAYDSEYATLTATVLDDSSNPMSGETVSFDIVSGGSVVENIGTAQTNSSGVATVSYYAEGAGDLNIQASVGMIVSEIFSLEDCIVYDSLTSASGKWTIPSGVTSVYSDEGWKTSADAYKQIKLTDKLTNACTVEITIVDYYASDLARYPPIVMYQYTNGETTPNQQLIGLWNSSSFDAVGTRINHAIVKGGVYKIEYTSSNVKVYEDGMLLATASNSVGFPTRFEFHIGTNGRYAIYKDLKVKPL